MACLFDNIERFGEAPALIGETNSVVTYRDLIERAHLWTSHITERSLILICCKNDVDCVAGYIGFQRASHVTLLVHHTAKAEHISNIVARFRPSYIFAPDRSGIYQITRTCLPSPKLHPELALLLSTSGTTGSRNFVRITANNILNNAQSIVDYLGVTKNDRAITTMPMSYSYGLSIIHSHMMIGASIILTEAPLISPVFWNKLKELHATSLNGVPFIYEMLKKLNFEKMELPDIRYLTQAGGKLSIELTREFIEIAEHKKIKFIAMYGQTEATARLSYLPWEYAKSKAGSIGQGIPGVSLSLVDETGSVIQESNKEGELVCTGANISMGYACEAPDLEKPDENLGALYTGDVAMRDEDGFYFIVGRKKRILKIFGTRINLDEVEELLNRAGHSCACTGTDDCLKIYVVGSTSATMATLRNLISINPTGLKIIPIEAIPYTETGKINYKYLREMGP
jgi:acyl-coenzyme A synthetase/AMP-(fatty) acid ligase